MTNKTIDVFIINYNGKNTVLTTIETIYNSNNVNVRITIIDDHSTDGSPEIINEKYPEISIHIMPVNFKKLNVLRDKALGLAENEYIFITDNDISFDKDCLGELLRTMVNDEAVATCTPRLMYWDQPNKIYTSGTRVHFIGTSVADNRDKIYEENDAKPSTNSGGGIMLIRKSAAKKVGGFDQKLLMGWGDDGEFYQRLLRSGYKCLYVPTAFALHEDKLIVTARKFRAMGQTYNRIVLILSHYSWALIILAIPAFVIYEFFQLAFVVMKGLLFQYLKGNFYVIKTLPYIMKKRKAVQRLKVVSDKEILFAGNIYVSPSLIEKHKLIKHIITLFSSLLNLYWSILKKVIP